MTHWFIIITTSLTPCPKILLIFLIFSVDSDHKSLTSKQSTRGYFIDGPKDAGVVPVMIDLTVDLDVAEIIDLTDDSYDDNGGAPDVVVNHEATTSHVGAGISTVDQGHGAARLADGAAIAQMDERAAGMAINEGDGEMAVVDGSPGECKCRCHGLEGRR